MFARLLLLFFVVVLVLVALAIFAPPARAYKYHSPEWYLLRDLNRYRRAHDLSTVRPHGDLNRAARHWSARLVELQFLRHGKFAGRIERFYGPCGAAGEVLAATPGTAYDAFKLWLASPSHREVLDFPGWDRVGIDARFCSWRGLPSRVWVVDFVKDP